MGSVCLVPELGFGADYSSVRESQAGLPLAGCVCVGGEDVDTPHRVPSLGEVSCWKKKMPSSVWEVGQEKERVIPLACRLSPGLCLLLFPTPSTLCADPATEDLFPPERSLESALCLSEKRAH